ncbi:MAG: hypothetical protein HZA27_05100, partial [Candidatus Omnitrophica bacterium]|nr:hypothetical protein [Candidatus Omnitrophota bacterium]
NAIFNTDRLKPGAIICDASLPSIIAGKASLRPDTTLIKAGLVSLPYPGDLNLDLGLPKGIICACLAETMLLALDERFVDYSLGENINLDKMEEIADLATQYGFEIWVPEAPIR